MDAMKEEAISKLVQSFADEQPGIMAFIMAQEEDFSDDDLPLLQKRMRKNSHVDHRGSRGNGRQAACSLGLSRIPKRS